ncbi:MAG: hypothetical protein ABI180_09115 [Microcoleus sp.]
MSASSVELINKVVVYIVVGDRSGEGKSFEIAPLDELGEGEKKAFSFFVVFDARAGNRVFLRKYFCYDRQKW